MLAPQCLNPMPREVSSTAAPSAVQDLAVAGLKTLNGTAYIELPKSSSTLLRRHALLRAPADDTLPPLQRRAYTFVREPLERFLSGYGTLEARLSAMSESLLPAWTRQRDDVARFEHFVDYFIATAPEQGFADFNHTAEDAADRRARGRRLTNSLWAHMVPQLWLIQAWGAPSLAFMGHVESLDADLLALHHLWGVVRPNVTRQASEHNKNVDEGRDVVDRTRLRQCAPRAIAKVVAHLRRDYECLGYTPPSAPSAGLPLPSHCSQSTKRAWQHYSTALAETRRARSAGQMRDRGIGDVRAAALRVAAAPAKAEPLLGQPGSMAARGANRTRVAGCAGHRTVAGRRACSAAHLGGLANLTSSVGPA